MKQTATKVEPRKVGRPKGTQGKRQLLGLYVPPELYDKVVEIAAKEHRSLSSQGVHMLERDIATHKD